MTNEPFFNETFWVIYQPNYRNSDFALKDIIHYNSLNDDVYLHIPEMTPKNAQLVFVPERLIEPFDQELIEIVKNYKDILINKEITFIKHIEGHKWILQDMILKIVKSTNDHNI
jgi:hypothetical protein